MGQIRKKDDLLIIDNFLPADFFNNMQKHFMSANMEWYFNPLIVSGQEKDLFQFCHTVFKDLEPRSIAHETFVVPILRLLRAKAVIRAKVNLQTRYNEIINTGYHTDVIGDDIHRTCILYINDNNGLTRFENRDLEINSVANRILDFPSDWMHTGTTHTDSQTRVVLNINYVPAYEEDEIEIWAKEQ